MKLRATLLAVALGCALLAPVSPGSPAAAAPAPAPAAAAAAARTAAARGVTTTDGCVRSRPEPGTTDPVRICFTLFRPAGASARAKVPMLMHSHGWGGRRAELEEVERFLRHGYGVLSFDQRGFGESGGFAHVMNPRFEGTDVRRLVALVATLPWVLQDGPGDPRLGAVGGSYGGGYQFVGALEELRLRGKPVFDALAPEITWSSLGGSLAPQGVVRTEWALALSAAALPSNSLEPRIYRALVEGVATGEWPDGSGPIGEDLVRYFGRNGPRWHVEQGRRLDIPVLFGQGTTDGLFPLEQGLTNWRTLLTPRARRHSIFVGYNGGHVLPQLFPAGVDVTSDPCSRRLGGGDFRRLSIRFFDEHLKGRPRRLKGYGRIHLATPASRCTSVDSVAATRAVAVDDVASTTAVGLPNPVEVATGPIRVAGTPYVTASVTTSGADTRAFYGLAVGRTPLDARLVQNNVLPHREQAAVTGVRRRLALPSVAVDVPAGQRLFLLVTPISDTFALMGSRTPGTMTLSDARVHLPVVR